MPQKNRLFAIEPFIDAKWFRLVISTASVSLFLVMWEIIPRIGLVDVSYISSPSRVVSAFIELTRQGKFFNHLYVSFIEFSLGFALALVVGIFLGIIVGVFRKARHLIDPPIMALWSTPRLAMIPIFIVWMGIGLESKIAVVFIGAIIPILVNTAVGIRESDPILVQAARSFCAKDRDIFIKVLLPASLPPLMAGIRLAVGRATMGVVVAEMYVSQKGVGNQILFYAETFNLDPLLVFVVLVSLFAFTLTIFIRQIENRLGTWKET